VICSASPELFFRLDGTRIECRPMKGTAARGRTQAEDLAQARALHASEKERAENVMIVDMVRHDLGRVAQVGTVNVTRLFEVEKYPTIWQMTSTIEAKTEAGLGEIFRALFPAASVTGAPKVRTMEIIAGLEPLPRRLYTGTIGFFAPGRRAQFNVAIRTVLANRRTGCVEYGVGSGITWDSDPEAEWQECRSKARILAPRVPPFSLLETMRWTLEEGYYLLETHLERLQDSALYFGFRLDLAALRLELERLAARLGRKRRRIRLLVTKEGRITLEAKALPKAVVKPQRIALARAPVDSSDPFLYHKTTNRAVYEAARAACPGFDDVLLFNEQGEITESTIANVAVDIAGKLYTPPVFFGLLPGTLRAHLLQQGDLLERPITLEELLRSPRILLLNSLRGMYPVEVVGAGHA
jgi:para-aminobenzoate synthetase/4-amino-4-deoxychorismate lyase